MFKDVKIKKAEAFRIKAMAQAIKLRNFRVDLDRNPDKIVQDAKRIEEYLTSGT